MRFQSLLGFLPFPQLSPYHSCKGAFVFFFLPYICTSFCILYFFSQTISTAQNDERILGKLGRASDFKCLAHGLPHWYFKQCKFKSHLAFYIDMLVCIMKFIEVRKFYYL